MSKVFLGVIAISLMVLIASVFPSLADPTEKGARGPIMTDRGNSSPSVLSQINAV